MSRLTIQKTFELALQNHRAGRLQDAERLYREILAIESGHSDAMHCLGVIARQTKHNDISVDLIRRAVALNPNNAEAHNNLGLALHDLGKLDQAIAAYRVAIALNRNYAAAYINLGFALEAKGYLDEAIAAHRQATACKPESAEACHHLGNALKAQERIDDAMAAYRHAIIVDPNYVAAHNNLGAALKYKGQLDDAIVAFRRAISIRPNYPKAHYNLGNTFLALGRLDEAVDAYRQAIVHSPDDADTHLNLAMTLLQRGDWEEGWSEHEWRWKVKGLPSPRPFPQPIWTGQELKRQTILLHAEQGVGDSIQFLRYVPLVAGRADKVIVEVPRELQRLAERLPGVSTVVEAGRPLPHFDFHCPMVTLPLAFKTALATVPMQVPYLFPEQRLVKFWRDKLSDSAHGMKIGIVWAGNPMNKNDRNRSIAFSLLAPLGAVNDIHFYSLQIGEAARQATSPPSGMTITDWTGELHDFEDTAALVANMDLVISVDTAVAHLAGAMAKPVWILLPFSPEWRWLSGRNDSPWYPTMRLFRQGRRGDWNPVIAEVATALAEKARADSIGSP